MANKYFDLIAVMLLALAALAAAFTSVSVPLVSPLLAMSLVLVLPGYALTTALYPDGELGRVERLLFTLGLSLAVTVLGGFVINAASLGLKPQSWTVWLASLTLAATAVAVARRSRELDAPNFDWSPHLSVPQALLLTLAALGVFAALNIARTGALTQPSAPFTQFWLMPAGANVNALRLGVSNMESVPMQYKVQVKVGGSVVGEWNDIVLAPGQTWNETWPLAASEASAEAVEAMLYRMDAPQDIYRRARWQRNP